MQDFKFPLSLEQCLFQHKEELELIEDYKDKLSPEVQLKIKVINDILYFFKKYPTLCSLGISHRDNYSLDAYKGWVPYVVTVGWDSMANIQRTKEFKDSNCCIGIFIHNSMNSKRHEKIIPCNDTLKSWYDVFNEIHEHFLYLNKEENKKFYREMLEKNQFSNAKFTFDTYSDYGHFNINLMKNIYDFLGDDFISKLRYEVLQNTLANKSNNINKGKKI